MPRNCPADQLCVEVLTLLVHNDPDDVTKAYELIREAVRIDLQLAFVLTAYNLVTVLRDGADRVGEDLREAWARHALLAAQETA